MHITTLGFLIFICAGIFVYYLLPQSARWTVLLGLSALFVFIASPFGYAFILLSAASIYFAGRRLEALQREKRTKEKKQVLLAALSVNLGVLVLLKFVPEGLSIADAAFGTALSGRIVGKSIPGILKVGCIEAGIEEVNWFPKGHMVDSRALKKPAKLAVLSVGYYHGFGVTRLEKNKRAMSVFRGGRRRKLFVKLGYLKP